MAKTWGIQDDAERDVTADSQAQRKIIHSRIIVTISHASWEAAGEACPVSPIEDRSVTPQTSWLTQCPLL